MKIHIRNGRLIDPANGRDEPADLFVADGRVAAIGQAPAGFHADRTLEADGRLVTPGFVDLQARLREPGQEHKATIASETRAAAAGGITTLCCPPDTDPVLDTPAVAKLIRQRAGELGLARVLPVGALTRDLAGEQLAEMSALADAGCVAVSNASRAIANTQILCRALEYAATLGLTVILRPEDPWLGAAGCVHQGAVSTRLGLPGIPEYAEVIGVTRDLQLIEQTGVTAHFGQISSLRAIELIRQAREQGLPVSADVTPHHLFLTEMDVAGFNSDCHVRPPLRSQRDRDGLRQALTSGAVAAIASDHQPHDADAKLAPFAETEPGIAGLETLLPLVLRLTDEQVLPLHDAIALLTHRPAAVLGLDAGTLAPGAVADIAIIDPEARWQVADETLNSRGKNTPFRGWEMKGHVTHTLLEGRVVFERDPNN